MNKRPIFWTKEKCHYEALKYSYRYEFQKKSIRAYSAACRNGWLDDVCSHMQKTGNWYKRCVYVYEFSDNSAYIGLTYNLSERNLNRKKNKNDAVTKHINNTNLKPKLKQLSDYVSVNLASSLEIFYIDKYRKNGWNILNVAKGGTVGNHPYRWTFNNCKNEALKYKTRNEFKKNNKSAYEASRINGWLNEICSHMKFVLTYWTYELCEKEALKYGTRRKLHDNCYGAYYAGLKNNWLDKIFPK